MKINKLRLFVFLAGLCGLLASVALAQTVVDPAPIVPAPAQAITAADTNAAAGVANTLINLLSTLLPAKIAEWLVAIGSVIGTLRLAFKPILTAVETYVKNSPSASDDALLDKAEHSAAFRLFAWALDFFASIKVGPQFTAKPEGKE